MDLEAPNQVMVGLLEMTTAVTLPPVDETHALAGKTLVLRRSPCVEDDEATFPAVKCWRLALQIVEVSYFP